MEHGSKAGLTVCYFGTYSIGEGYPVNRVLIEGVSEPTLRRSRTDPLHVR